MLEEALAEGGPWILGDQLTLADLNVMPYAALWITSVSSGCGSMDGRARPRGGRTAYDPNDTEHCCDDVAPPRTYASTCALAWPAG